MSSNAIWSLDVHHVAVEELDDLNSLVVGVAENADGSGKSLLFSTTLTPFDEQDRLLGQDTYCISTEWGATVYGGVMSCILQDNVLVLTLDPEAADILELSKECFLNLHTEQDAILQLRQGLRRILSSSSISPSHLLL